MLVARFAALAALVPFLAGCGATPGEFSYEVVNDEFTGIQSTRAVAEAPDKDGSNSKLELSLRCERQPGVRKDAYRDSLLTFRILDEKGEGQLVASISLKMNGSQPFMSEGLEKLAHPTDTGDTELHYVYAAAMGLPQDQWPMALSAVTMGGGGISSFVGGLLGGLAGANDQPSPERVLRLVNESGAEPTSILVRYESLAGQFGTAEFDLTDENFRRVLKDCGWDVLLAPNESVVNGGEQSDADSADIAARFDLNSRATRKREFAEEMPLFVGRRKGTCVFTRDGASKIDGPCVITGTGHGNFIMRSTSEEDGAHGIVSIFRQGDTATGFWQTSAHDSKPLGNLHRQGFCWIGENVEVCASPVIEVVNENSDIWNVHVAQELQSQDRSTLRATADKLRACGLEPRIDDTSNFDKPGELRAALVVTGPFRELSESEADLTSASSCLGWIGSQSVRMHRRVTS